MQFKPLKLIFEELECIRCSSLLCSKMHLREQIANHIIMIAFEFDLNFMLIAFFIRGDVNAIHG